MSKSHYNWPEENTFKWYTHRSIIPFIVNFIALKSLHLTLLQIIDIVMPAYKFSVCRLTKYDPIVLFNWPDNSYSMFLAITRTTALSANPRYNEVNIPGINSHLNFLRKPLKTLYTFAFWILETKKKPNDC